MKLLFPNGEHGPLELKDGTTKIGSGAGVDVTLVAPGIAPQHCTIEQQNGAGVVRLSAPGNVVVVNGKQVVGEAPLKAGDLLLVAKVGVRVVSVERATAAAAAAPVVQKQPDPNEDDGKTRVRMALPKYVLRGVSGSTFGKTFPLYGTMTIGRAADCNISIPAEEISRHHAKLQVMPEGVAVEDLGSANGTFVASKRVHQGMLRAGEELRLDTVRFLLVAPGMESAAATTRPTPAPAPEPVRKSSAGLWITIGVLAAAAAAAALWQLGYIP
ncbi:MAG TPA: FHA domain-containing protein [Candidatus Saccharimonadia bacterium]|nr:FHA domain-containing protein [Candidatus Saccharimonadia bacterium]